MSRVPALNLTSLAASEVHGQLRCCSRVFLCLECQDHFQTWFDVFIVAKCKFLQLNNHFTFCLLHHWTPSIPERIILQKKILKCNTTATGTPLRRSAKVTLTAGMQSENCFLLTKTYTKSKLSAKQQRVSEWASGLPRGGRPPSAPFCLFGSFWF